MTPEEKLELLLLRAHVPDAVESAKSILREAITQEREACAKIAELYRGEGHCITKAIRARGE